MPEPGRAEDISYTKRARVRYATTLLANAVRFVLGFATGILLARGLGPAEFGNFNFLLVSFMTISQLLDMGTSTAFYTFVSRERRGRLFFLYYAAWLSAQFLFTVLLISVLLPESVRGLIWLGHGRRAVLIAFLASFTMNQIWQAVSQAGESIRETLTVQAYNALIAATYLVFVLLFMRFGLLGVQNLFVFITAQYLFFAVALGRSLKGRLYGDKDEGAGAGVGEVFGEYRAFCAPLVVYTVVTFIGSFLNNWFLQKYGGPVEQGYYAVGNRFSGMVGIGTASAVYVLWKEFAEAQAGRDDERMRAIFSKASRGLYFMAALMACFLIPYSREVIMWLVGPSYEPAWLPLAVMLLYPLHQSLGQISAVLFYSMGNTSVLRNIALVLAPVGLPVTYFILASKDAAVPGLGMGATGMAAITVVATVLSVNIQLFMISRLKGWKFEISYQLTGVLLLLSLSFGAKLLTGRLLSVAQVAPSTQLHLALGLAVYMAGAVLAVWRMPYLLGMEKDELRATLKSARDAAAALFRKGR